MSNYMHHYNNSYSSYKDDKSRSIVEPMSATSQGRNYEYQRHHTSSSSFPVVPQHSTYRYGEKSSSASTTTKTNTDPGKKEAESTPEMDHIIADVMFKLKSKGTFDRFRQECMADIDTKPAYINLNNRVKYLVECFLKKTKWTPTMPKVKIRENMRKYVSEARNFDSGIDRIVDQVVDPKTNSVFFPMVEEEVYSFLGIEKPKEAESEHHDVSMNEQNNDDMDVNVEERCKTAEESDTKVTIESQHHENYKETSEDMRIEVTHNYLPEKQPRLTEPFDVRRERPRLLSEEEPLPPGEEPMTPLIDNENSKDSSSPIDYGMAHTPEEEYDETRIREKENQYLKSEEASFDKIEKTIGDGERTIYEGEEENDDIDYEYDDEDVEEEEEEESPPFEKIGESPPPSPQKSAVNGSESKMSLSDASEEANVSPEVTKEDFTQMPLSKGNDEEKTKEKVNEPAVEKSNCPTPEPLKMWHIPEDVEDTPVYFLEPIPSLAEKTKFYLEFRQQHPSDEDNQHTSKETKENIES